MKTREFKKSAMWAFLSLLIFAGVVFAADPAASQKTQWFTILGAMINTAGVLAVVQILKVNIIPAVREKAPWILPILTGAIGPAIAALQNLLSGVLAVSITLDPVVAVFTGAAAVAVNQAGKQITKPTI